MGRKKAQRKEREQGQADLRNWATTAKPSSLQEKPQEPQESSALTPNGKHITVTMERVSTGGTHRHVSFDRSASGPMTAAERAKKKRLKTTLFPEKAASQRAQHAEAERRRYHEQWGDGEREQQQLFPESPEGGAEGGAVGGISIQRFAVAATAGTDDSTAGTDDYTIDMSAVKFCSSSFWPKALMFRIAGADAVGKIGTSTK